MTIAIRCANRFINLICAVTLLAGCVSFIGAFSEQAYRNATTLKAESIALVKKSTNRYTAHHAEVEALLVRVDAAYEYANGLPNNQLSAEQWAVLRDPDGHLLGGWAVTWRKRNRLSTNLSENLTVQISDAFDAIICLEINKRAAAQC